MFKMILVFMVMTGTLHLAYLAWSSFTNKEKIGVMKSFGYAALVSAVAVVVLSVIVILF